MFILRRPEKSEQIRICLPCFPVAVKSCCLWGRDESSKPSLNTIKQERPKPSLEAFFRLAFYVF